MSDANSTTYPKFK